MRETKTSWGAECHDARGYHKLPPSEKKAVQAGGLMPAGNIASEEVDGAARREASNVTQMFGDAVGVGEDAVNRGEGGDCREHRQDTIGGQSQNAMVADIVVNPPKDVLSSLGRDLGGRSGLTSAVSAFNGESAAASVPLRVGLEGKIFSGSRRSVLFDRRYALHQKSHCHQSADCSRDGPPIEVGLLASSRRSFVHVSSVR